MYGFKPVAIARLFSTSALQASTFAFMPARQRAVKALVAPAKRRTLSNAASAITGIMMFNWNWLPAAPQKAIVCVVADHPRGDLHQALAHHRVDLAGHDRAARLEVGQD